MKNLCLFLALLTSLPLSAQMDTLPTANGDIILTPILHASMVLEYQDQHIFIDPYGGAERYARFPAPDLVLITHVHGDHLNHRTLDGLDLSQTALVAPQSVIDELGDITFQQIHHLPNGETMNWEAVQVEAVPMYNLPESPDSRHPKGKGNGYVLSLGGERLYVSGDTEDIPEMRNLKNIDYAFVCMNLPYTMTVEQAASAVLEFQPEVCFPFHYRGKDGFSNVGKFKELVNEGSEKIEVRLLDWYPE